MGDVSRIEWTDATWNPTTGCTKVSPGCKACYAERVTATRLRTLPQYAGTVDERGRWTGKVNLVESALDLPLRWRKPRRVFVNSMSDLFHEDVPFEFIDKVFRVMLDCPQHTFQVLTKRADLMRAYIHDIECCNGQHPENPPILIPKQDHIWLGVSVEDQQRADERIPHLLETPAAVRFLSVEPMLGPVEFWSPRLHWAVFGCESDGPRLGRPCDLDWVRQGLEQCAIAGIAAFVKQIPINGRLSRNPDEWPADLRVREYPRRDA